MPTYYDLFRIRLPREFGLEGVICNKFAAGLTRNYLLKNDGAVTENWANDRPCAYIPLQFFAFNAF
jgi:hypothetical protein